MRKVSLWKWTPVLVGVSALTVADATRGTEQTVVPSVASENGSLKDLLVARERQSWEAWKGRDGKFFQEFLSEDHVEVGFNGRTNKASVVAGVESPVCVVKSYAVDRFELTAFDPNTALLTYHAVQDTACGGRLVPSPVWASSLYVRRDGKWLNAAYQQTQTTR